MREKKTVRCVTVKVGRVENSTQAVMISSVFHSTTTNHASVDTKTWTLHTDPFSSDACIIQRHIENHTVILENHTIDIHLK